MPGIIESLFERRFHPSNPAEWFMKLMGGSTAAGVDVTTQSSLRSTAVLGSVRILAEGVGSLPLILYSRTDNDGRQRETAHPLFPLLRWLPNPEMTSIELRETLQGHAALWGNGYAEIEYNNAGAVRGLWPLRPDKTRPERHNGKLVYIVRLPTGGEVGLPFNRVMHIKGLGYDGVTGYSPIALARQTVGLTLATEEFGARFFANGAKPGTVLKHPGQLSDKAEARLRKSWEMMHQGLENSHRVAILEEGLDLVTVGIPPEDAQFLETRKFQVSEIARLFRVPPHMLADLDRATFSNIEQMSLEFVIYTLQPWLTRWEQAIYRDLLTEAERARLFAEHLIDALLRGDTKSRNEAHAVGRQNGWLSANDIRRLENMNPVEGGDVYWMPVNMVPADTVASGATAPGDRRSERRTMAGWEQRARQVATGRRRLAGAMRGVIEDAAGRVIRREVNDVRRAVRKFLGQRSEQDFTLWLQEFYEEHREFWKKQLLPILRSYAEQVGVSVADELGGEPRGADDIPGFLEAYLDAVARRQVGSSIGQLRTLLEQAIEAGQDPAESIEERLDRWEAQRPAQIAEKETHFANNALAKAFYVLVGVSEIRWVASGGSCPYCTDLDGRVVGIQKFFVQKGEDFEPEGAERPLAPRSNISHPPVHDGCDCTIVAEG